MNWKHKKSNFIGNALLNELDFFSSHVAMDEYYLLLEWELSFNSISVLIFIDIHTEKLVQTYMNIGI